ncbi:MAG TPA: hypothetical protein VNA25_08080 [Phycisphaerae bacterium]|nr:hypothetical protein [Phycisphaerae bacterium]
MNPSDGRDASSVERSPRGAARRWRRWLEAAVVVALFAVVAVTHYIPRSTVFDSLYILNVSMSIIHEGDLDLDEYVEAASPLHYSLERRGGHVYSVYPIGTPLLAAPFVWAIEPVYPRLMGATLGDDLRRGPMRAEGLQRLIASILTAAATVILYLIARARLSAPWSLIVGLVFAYCTPMYSTASRALWQHGPLVFTLTCALGLLVAAERRPWLAQFAALPLAFSYLVRPTAAIPIVVLSVLVLIRHRRWFLPFAAWGLAVAAAFAWLNLRIYGSVLPPYYRPADPNQSEMVQALAGTLVSPGRGVLIFSPVLVLSIVGAVWGIRSRGHRAFDGAVAAVVVLHWLLVASWWGWRGGWCFGPRLFTDVMPFFVLLLVPLLERLRRAPLRRRLPAIGALAVLALVSFLIHAHGASSAAVWDWNRAMDADAAKVWDWGDLQFLRGL